MSSKTLEYRDMMYAKWGKRNFTLVCDICEHEFDLLGEDNLDLWADAHNKCKGDKSNVQV